MELCADVGEVCVQLETRYACLDGGISVVVADAEDAVHIVQRDAERAFGCDDSPFNAGPRSVGDYRHLIFCTDFDNFGNFGVGFRESDGIRERASVIGGIASVCVSDGTICAEACSEKILEFLMGTL
jgi:hypothetical protein